MADQVKYNKLQGKSVLIVGGSSGTCPPLSPLPLTPNKTNPPTLPGIGYAIAEAALESGATVTISSSNPTRISTAISKLQTSYPSASNRITGHACDLSTSSTLESNLVGLLNKTTSNGTIPLDHAIYTAGDALAAKPLSSADLPFILQAGMVRFFAPMLLAKHLPAHIRPGPDSSFTITTGAVGEKPIPDWTVVGSYATGLQGLGRQLALDLRPLRVNVVSPGAVRTELWDSMEEGEREALMKGFEGKMATGRVGRPEDLAEAYLYCMRDGNVTGALVSSNGGNLIM